MLVCVGVPPGTVPHEGRKEATVFRIIEVKEAPAEQRAVGVTQHAVALTSMLDHKSVPVYATADKALGMFAFMGAAFALLVSDEAGQEYLRNGLHLIALYDTHARIVATAVVQSLPQLAQWASV